MSNHFAINKFEKSMISYSNNRHKNKNCIFNKSRVVAIFSILNLKLF